MLLKDIKNYLEGNTNYYIGAPAHIKEQALYRAVLCKDCTTYTSSNDTTHTRCKGCGCSTPNVFYAPNKEDAASRWGAMVSATEWELFKSTDIYKNVMANTEYEEANSILGSSTSSSGTDSTNYFSMYFKSSEFDSPDLPGSGARFMSSTFTTRLALARHLAGVPFRINSGYRTAKHNQVLEAQGYPVAKNSAHLRGFAADISCTDSNTRYKIVQALLDAGLHRIGIANSFIHADNDPTLPPNQIWIY